MATTPTSGWHAGSISPSYVAVQNVLGHAAPAPAPNTGGGAGPATQTTNSGGTAGPDLASLLAQILGGAGFGGGGNGSAGGGLDKYNVSNKSGLSFLGGGGGASGTVYDPFVGRSGGGLGGPTGITDQAGNPIYTPEQSYSMYLQQLGGATSRSPQMDILNQILGLDQQIAYSPGGGRYAAAGYVPTKAGRAQNAQLNTLQSALPLSNPYSYAYGAPAANAPAQTPQWGYPTSYGSPTPGGSGRSAPNTNFL